MYKYNGGFTVHNVFSPASYSRILFWSCEQTNAINVTRIDMEDPEDAIIGSILAGNGDQPRSVALHPQLRYLFKNWLSWQHF